jgi:formamidopyrimidine-DNA glycosylase
VADRSREPDKHDHLLLETDDGRRLALNDPRRFGSVDLVRRRSWRLAGRSPRWGRSRST